MNMTIKFKATYLAKAFLWLIIIGILISSVIFLGLKLDLSYRYFFSMVIVFSGILIAFYLNRNELERLDVNVEQITLSFFNKVFFKREPISYARKDIETKHVNGIIEIFYKGELIGMIRKESLTLEDWEKVDTYFTSQSI